MQRAFSLLAQWPWPTTAFRTEAIELVPEEKVMVLADDSISVRKFVGRMLEKAGYRVKLGG